MALLQVRDFPSELYALLSLRAQMENRSITQQTIYMLKEGLKDKSESKVSPRLAALNSLGQMNLSLKQGCTSPSELIREDRDR